MNYGGLTRSCHRRSQDAVNEILSLAKLVKSDILPTSQALFFTSSNDKTFKLLELNNELLKHIENNDELFIKGCDDDDLVICSKTDTYHVTSAETSNNLLLSKPAIFFNDISNITEEKVQPIEICETFQVCLEANIGKTSLTRLTRLLEKTIYRGPEYENEIEKSFLFTMDQMKNIIQISDAELMEVLSYMDIFEIGDYVREIDFEYHFRVLSYMLKLLDENSWSLDTVDYFETVDSLNTIVPEDVVKSLFQRYTEPSEIIDGIQLYKYKQEDVCKLFARVILRTAGKFRLDEFLQAWNESVPEGMTPNEEMLYGISIIDKFTSPKTIWAFEENNLPSNITERFQVLFEAKDKWTVPEITPYIRRLATHKQDVNALLAKHARASKIDGVKYYSAKHAK